MSRPAVSSARRLPVLCMLVLLAVTTLADATAANADIRPNGPRLRGVALNYKPGTYPRRSRLDADLGSVVALGADHVRIPVRGHVLERGGRGRWNPKLLRHVDYLVRGAARRGIGVLLTYRGTPCWNAPNNAPLNKCAPQPPRRTREYARTAAWLAARYSKALVGIELWNEPNHEDFFRGSPAQYAALVRVAYRRIKRRAPTVPVLAGSVQFSDTDFVRAIYRHGIRGHLDYLSIHPYDLRPTGFGDPGSPNEARPRTSFRSGPPTIRRVLANAGDRKRKLWFSEFGWPACPSVPHCESDQTIATYLRRAIEVTAGWRWVRGATVFALRDGPNSLNWSDRFGLVGAGHPSRRPGFFSLREAFDRFRRPPRSRITRVRKRPRRRSAVLTYTANKPATFVCRVDRHRLRSCPVQGSKSLHRLGPGRHAFRLTAVDADGTRGTTTVRRFRIRSR